MSKAWAFSFAIFLIAAGNSWAQLPGSLDQTWGGSGIVYTNVANFDTWAEDIVEQADGKIVVAGGIYDGMWSFTTIRYTPFGLLDTTFGSGGMVITGFGNPGGDARALTLQSDGKIVVCGSYISGPSPDSIGGLNTDFAIVRYLSNGDLDSTFGINGIVCNDFGTDQDIANAVAIQTDGKIIISGERGDGSIKNCITVRYLPNGTIDSTFGINGIAATSLSALYRSTAVTIQQDGKIVIAGQGSFIIRYNADGTPDLSFGSGGFAWLQLDNGSKKIVVQPDNKIVYAGTIVGSISDDLKIIRVNENGTQDILFGVNGSVTSEITIYNDWWRAHDVQDDGRIVVAGMAIPDSGIFYFSTARFNSNGTIDSTYGDSGKVFTRVGKSDAIVHSMTIQANGRIIVAGSVVLDNMTQVAIVRYNGGTVSSTDENPMAENIRIYPNPSEGIISIKGIDQFDQIEFYNVLSELVYKSSDQSRTLDLSFLPRGLYLIKVSFANKLIQSEKLILY